MTTIQDAIAAARYEMYDLTYEVGLVAADIVHRSLSSMLPELCRETMTIALVNGTMEYDLDPLVVQMEGATYKTAGGAGVTVMDVTVETLRSKNRNFRAQPADSWASKGVSMYVSSRLVAGVRKLSVGFSPPPDADSAGGTLTLYVSKVPATVDLTTPLLPGLQSSRVYVEGILYYAARAIRPGDAGAYLDAYKMERDMAAGLVRTRQEGVKRPEEQNVRANG